MGVQGRKRCSLYKSLGMDVITVDNANPADLKHYSELNLSQLDLIIISVPETSKREVIYGLLGAKILVVEKPLFPFDGRDSIVNLYGSARKAQTLIYTSYNHAFEPSLNQIPNLIKNNKFGKLYEIDIEYSNGTASDIMSSVWRNKGLGVIEDLLPHCLQILFDLFPNLELEFESIVIGKSETDCPDFSSCILKFDNQYVRIKNSYLSWKNNFSLRLIFEGGILTIDSLTKWSDVTLSWGMRTRPSGLPNMQKIFFSKSDVTYTSEFKFLNEYDSANMNADEDRNKKIADILGRLPIEGKNF